MLVMSSVFLCLQVFGASITDAILSHDMLIVMYASGYVKFYSFQYILQQVSNDQVFRLVRSGSVVECLT